MLKVGDGLITIGRDDDNTVTLRSPFVSRRHSQIVYEAGNYFVESLGLNGTTVANKLVAKGQRCKIDFGDEIRLGEYSLYMMEPSVRRISGAARAMSPRRRVIELEQKM
ncbi:MAG: FHA domain-containing protein, partial [Planctomycetota bacterium]|nr:FHA domain-containing protein [Planctomycetota bacterium]